MKAFDKGEGEVGFAIMCLLICTNNFERAKLM